MKPSEDAPKLIYVEPNWKTHSSATDLSLSSPNGYKFVSGVATDRSVKSLARYDFFYNAKLAVEQMIPLQLGLSIARSVSQPRADCIYALSHVVMSKRPWILDMGTEMPFLLASNEKQFEKTKSVIRSLILSENCRQVIFMTDSARRAFLQGLGAEISDKLSVVYWGVRKRNFQKAFEQHRVRILFVSSSNIGSMSHFYGKGGMDLLRAFAKLRRKYANIELVIRSAMSEQMEAICLSVPGVTVIRNALSWAEIERVWESSDIFALPVHAIAPGLSLLEAKSYELPVVTTSIPSNRELISDGVTGLLASFNELLQYSEGDLVHMSDPVLKMHWSQTLVDSLVEKLEILIGDEELRRTMGKRARLEVESGQFSIEARNRRLAHVLDKAIDA